MHSSGASKGPQPLVLRENKTDVRITPDREPPAASATKFNASSAAYPGANLVNSGQGGPITFQQQAVRAEVIDNVKKPNKDLMHHPNLRLLPVDRCGRNAAESTERVRGYQRASIGEYPWVAQLGELRGWQNKYYLCEKIISLNATDFKNITKMFYVKTKKTKKLECLIYLLAYFRRRLQAHLQWLRDQQTVHPDCRTLHQA